MTAAAKPAKKGAFASGFLTTNRTEWTVVRSEAAKDDYLWLGCTEHEGGVRFVAAIHRDEFLRIIKRPRRRA